MTEADDIVARYVDMWNEPDPERRRQRIAEVWATDGEHHVATLSAVGHPQLAARVNSAHQKWVVEHGYVFRSAGDAQRVHNAVRFTWHMLPADGGKVISTGVDLLILDPAGRVRLDYQFTQTPS